MDKVNRGQAGESALSRLAGLAILLAGAMAAFYAAYKVSYVSVDYGIHVDIARNLDWHDPVAMLKDHPEPVWHLVVRLLMRILPVGAERAAGLASGGLCALTYLLAAHFFYRGAGGCAPVPGAGGAERGRGGVSPRAAGQAGLAGRDTCADIARTGLSLPGAALCALLLCLSGAIYLPFFNKKPYLGQGSPNPWHNPTTVMVRPIGLLVFLLVMSACVRARRAGFRKGSGLQAWKGLLIALLLLASNLSKPSFVQIFYPAIFLLMLLWLFLYRGRNFPLGMQLLVCCLPSVALMGAQFLAAFYGKSNGEAAGVVIAPFKVAGLYTKNIAVSTLLVLAFPLWATLCAIARRAFDWTCAFAWLMLLCGMAEKFLLAEGGSRMAHGNFSWGYILALYYVWFIAVRDFARWKLALGAGRGKTGQASLQPPLPPSEKNGGDSPRAGGERQEKGMKNQAAAGARRGPGQLVSRFAFAAGACLLAAHFLSGIYYLFYLIVQGHGV